MSKSPLLRLPAPEPGGRFQRVTPEDAGWTYVGFEAWDLADGARIEAETGDREICVVMVAGRALVAAPGLPETTIGERASPFDGDPWSLYVPARSRYRVVAQGACEVAICSAPGTGAKPPRIVPPADVGRQTRGAGSNVRHVRDILPDTSPHAESLLVVEVITPGGNWSSYPSHKHDRDDPPRETLLEETYFHRMNPRQGYAVQRVYDDARDLDETFTLRDRDVSLVPRGYHPVGAAHGYDLYYLNVMAGPKRLWKFHNDPDHAWLFGRT
ncbi:MAG: 5-deoxy-glucuronate isomerase [Hyphomicrobiales bacterium]|nr:5-deoxy-glucuronate isomerase [Hyphomicrobiales bacterium]